MSRYSGLRESVARIGDRRAQAKNQALDALLKRAQLQQAGFQVKEEPGFLGFGGKTTLAPIPGFESKENLEREKLQMEVDQMRNPGRFGLATDLVPTKYDKFGRPSSYESQSQMQAERRSKLEDEIAKKELSTMTTNLPKLEQALQAANQLEQVFYQGIQPQEVERGDIAGGIQARMSGVPARFGAMLGANPELQKYLQNRKAFAGLIAKGGFGEAGMLTNQDIQRVVDALPNPGSTAEEARRGFREVQELLGAARRRFEKKKQDYISGTFGQQKQGQYQVGQIINVNGRQYRVIGGDPNDPEVEPV